LDENNIGDDGAKALAGALKTNKALQILYLDDTNIGDDGAKALADALKTNKALQTLYLIANNMSDDGAVAMAEALKTNKALQKLDLDRNNIGDDGAKALADALKTNKALQILHLCENNIGDDGAKALAESLKTNIALKELYIDEEIERIQHSNIDQGKVGRETFTEGSDGAVNERSINATGQLTTHTADANSVGASNEDAQINTERGDEIADREIEGLQSTISRLQRELAEKDRLVATQDEEIASMNAILRKIGDMANNKSGDTNHGGHDMQREIDGLRFFNDQYQKAIDSLKEQLKNSKPIETVDLTNEFDPSIATEDGSNDEEPPSKRRRMKSNLANALEQSQQMVAVKEEAIQRAAAAEVNAETARREKDAVEASLRDVQEDLEIQQETTEQVALTLDTWQSRFDRLYELADAAGVDAAVLRSIREGSST
jgi:Ran GTPase-activating protein (RanGAP) involved in mRNA processing and transport